MSQSQNEPTPEPQADAAGETPTARRLRLVVGALLGVGLVTAVVLPWTGWFSDPAGPGQESLASAMIPTGSELPIAKSNRNRSGDQAADSAADDTAGADSTTDSTADTKPDSASPNTGTPAAAKRSGSSPPATTQEAAFKQAILGAWKQYTTGHRLLNVKEGGTATIDVKLDGLTAIAFGEELHFDIKWTITGDELVFKTTGGTPKGSIDTITSLYGDKRVYRILDINAKQMLLQEGEEKKTPWDRVTPDKPTETDAPDAAPQRGGSGI